MYICIITARGGSKRIPGKNIRPFHGKPMLAWPLEAARDAGLFDHVLVSTDTPAIADVARAHGAEVPFLRPADLADDHTPAHKAARHMLEWAMQQWGEIPAFCHIYPTSPLLTAQTIREGARLVTETSATQAFTAMRVPFPLYQVLTRRADGRLEQVFSPAQAGMRSQDMPEAFIDAGQMYWFRTAHFLQHETRIDAGTVAVEIARERALDIDTDEDWHFAERMAGMLHNDLSAPR